MKLAGMIFPDNNSHFTEPTQAQLTQPLKRECWVVHRAVPGCPGTDVVSQWCSSCYNPPTHFLPFDQWASPLVSHHLWSKILYLYSSKTHTTQSSDFFNSSTSSGLLLKYSPILSEWSLQASTVLQSHLCFSLTDSPDCSFATTQKHSTNSLQLCRLFGISNHLAKFPNSLRLSTKSVKLQLSSTRCSPL